MRDMVDLYRYQGGHPSVLIGRFSSNDEAMRSAGHPDLAGWNPVDDRYFIAENSGGWSTSPIRQPECDGDRIELAIELAVNYGQVDGAHHKLWVIDQMVRVLAGGRYDQVVADACAGEDGPDTYEWDEGIAP